jgi:pimeloyl-ACP methyl ester carboxylesterase
LLEAEGHRVAAVELPSIDADPADPPGLYDDAAAVGAAIDAMGEPVVLCGHSYGGMVITAAAAGRDDVARLVYLCAFQPDVGESLFSLTGNAPAPWIRLLDDGRTIPDREHSVSTSYADCDEATKMACIDRLRPQVARPFTDQIEHAAWRDVPSTYVVCSEDASLPPSVQRDVFVPRATSSVELTASHSPAHSQPGRVAELLAHGV